MSERGFLVDSRDYEVEAASVWRRLMAGLVDWIVAFGVGILGIPFVQLVWALSDRGSFLGNLFGGVTVWSIPGLLLAAMVTHVAFGLLMWSKGSTPGHGLMGLRVLKPNETRISCRRSLARQIVGSPLTFAYLLPLSVLMVAWIVIAQRATAADSLLWIWEPVKSVTQHWWAWGFMVCLVLIVVNHVLMIWDAKGRGWHDRLVGAVVVTDRGVD